ncbi:hypothetical protein EYF80_056513 [Liparis tanakae]|uniref:Uncharacterized protein n=1 Tax=Liparis tanakae TaxID=230148 RepID=A0A4Z2EWS3_9TELE|nr:hypothetical protein EYF80_056513 [Liparis tanakae]
MYMSGRQREGHESTTSKGWAVSRISRRYRGEPSASGSAATAAAPPRGARSGRVVSLCRTFLVTAWVYVMDRKPCCWWAPSSTLAAVWGGGVMTRGGERTAGVQERTTPPQTPELRASSSALEVRREERGEERKEPRRGQRRGKESRGKDYD